MAKRSKTAAETAEVTETGTEGLEALAEAAEVTETGTEGLEALAEAAEVTETGTEGLEALAEAVEAAEAAGGGDRLAEIEAELAAIGDPDAPRAKLAQDKAAMVRRHAAIRRDLELEAGEIDARTSRVREEVGARIDRVAALTAERAALLGG